MKERERPWRDMVANLIWALFGWLVLWPLTRVIPRNSRIVAFYGRDGGKFLDNCKYLFLAARVRNDLGIRAVFLCRDDDTCRALQKAGALGVKASSASGYWLWLRAGTIVVDSVDIYRRSRFQSSRGATIVQLWHGIPLKLIQRTRVKAGMAARSRLDRFLYSLYLSLLGREARVDWLLSTSSYVTKEAFQSAFRYRRVSHAGYPRNDVLFRQEDVLVAQGVDPEIRKRVASFRIENHGSVGLYAPTFREDFRDPFSNGTVNLEQLSDAAVNQGILLLVKLHPWMHGRVQRMDFPGLCFVSPESDVYPVMREVDFLITDYSSIFFDFLLLDRPILFFAYDLKKYLSDERSMYFDYADMTPGPKVRSMEALTEELEKVAAGRDHWKQDRERIRNLVFDHPGPGAGDRLLTELFDDR